MQQNIGTVDRYLRLTSGILILAGGLQMKRASLGKGALMAVGAMKVAEGVTGWCPLLSAFGVTTLEEGSNAHSAAHRQSAQHAQQNQPAENGNQQPSHHQDHSSSNRPETSSHHSRTKSNHRSDDETKLERTEHHGKSHESKDRRSSDSNPAAERHKDKTDQEILYS